MLVITTIPPPPDSAELAGKERDLVCLTSEERRWSRGRFKTRSGREVALALPTGTRLKPGVILALGPDYFVEVEAALEPVLVAEIPDLELAVHVAYEFGNLHFPLAWNGVRLLVPDDSISRQVMRRFGVQFEAKLLPFEPIGATSKRHEH